MPSREEINKRIEKEYKKSITKRMRYIVPFSFCNEEHCIEKICNQVDSEGNRWVQTSVYAGDQDLYKFVLDSFADYGSRTDNAYVASSFLYQTGDGAPVKHLRYYKDYTENKIRKFNYIADFDINELGMILFGTGTGFLWYEIGEFYHVNSGAGTEEARTEQELLLTELYEFQFRFKELNRARFAELFRNKKGEEEELFLMGNWIARLLASIGLKVNFFAERENERLFLEQKVTDEEAGNGTTEDTKPDLPPGETGAQYLRVPDKAVLFTYCVFNEERVGVGFDFTAPAYYLTKGYKLSYATPDNIEEQMRYPFRNVCFYAVQEGAGYYAVYNGKNKSNFLGNMYDKVMNDYFLMYILLLHQKYTIVKFRDEIGANLSAVATEYSERVIHSSEEEKAFLANEELLDEMVTKLTVFITKNMHTSVSHIHHQNDFYSYVSEQLEIQKECADLSKGVRVLRDSLESKRAKYEAAKEGERDKQISKTLLFVSWITFVSFLFSVEDFIQKFWVTKTDGESVLFSEPIYLWVLKGFIVLFAFVSVKLIAAGAKQRLGRPSALWNKLKEWKEWIGDRLKGDKEKEQLYELQQDSLTGLYNMRYFAELEKSLVKKAMRRGKDLLVLMVDVDNLDDINSQKGRNQGDAVVKEVAVTLKEIASKYKNMKVLRKEEDQILLIEVLQRDALGERKKELIKALCPGKDKNTGEENKLPTMPISFGFAQLKKDEASVVRDLESALEDAYFELRKMKSEKQERERRERERQEREKQEREEQEKASIAGSASCN